MQNNWVIDEAKKLIYKDMPYDYFQITFQNGSGSDWGYFDDSYIFNRIRKAIEINAELHNFSGGGLINEKKVEEFLSLAYKIYEAY